MNINKQHTVIYLW